MKGEMFNLLAEFIERKKGGKAFSNLVQYTNIETEGPFNAADNYPDSDFYTLLDGASSIYHLRIEEMQKNIGTCLFRHLLTEYADFLNCKKAKKIILSLDKLMRIEINKFSPEFQFPEFLFKDLGEKGMEIIALSENKAFFLIESLVKEVSDHCKESITICCEETEYEGKEAFKYFLTFEGRLLPYS
jgi:hypothetical protein